MNRLENFKAGFIRENPIFGLYLGLCSALAISTSLNNAVGMGVAVTIVLILSNVIISAIRNITPDEIRIPVYIVVIAALVKSIQMLIQAYAFELNEALGIFLPLIVVNCIILGRAEAFASKNGLFDSALDGLGMGLGYTCGLIVMSTIRQIMATGVIYMTNPFDSAHTLFTATLFPAEYSISLMKDPVGAFFTFASLAAALTAYKNAKNKKAWNIGVVAVAAVLVGLIAVTGEFNIHADEEVNTPVEEVSNKLNAEAVSSVAANVVSVEGDYASAVVTVEADGFGALEGNGANVYVVTVANGVVESVEMNEFNDTQGIGDRVDATYLESYKGVAEGFEIDGVSGATVTSKSAVKAVATALEEAAKLK